MRLQTTHCGDWRMAGILPKRWMNDQRDVKARPAGRLGHAATGPQCRRPT